MVIAKKPKNLFWVVAIVIAALLSGCESNPAPQPDLRSLYLLVEDSAGNNLVSDIGVETDHCSNGMVKFGQYTLREKLADGEEGRAIYPFFLDNKQGVDYIRMYTESHTIKTYGLVCRYIFGDYTEHTISINSHLDEHNELCVVVTFDGKKCDVVNSLDFGYGAGPVAIIRAERIPSH